MTYHEMRLLFAGLARHDGRLSVLTARSQDPMGLWTVVLRDHLTNTRTPTTHFVASEAEQRKAARPCSLRRPPLSAHDAHLHPSGLGRSHGFESPNHLIVNFSEIVNRMKQDTDPIFFGSKSAASQLQVTQSDIDNILQSTP